MGDWRIPQKIGLVLAVFYVQQMSVVSDLGIDLPLILTVLIGLRSSPARAAAWGGLLGFTQDALSAGWVGPCFIPKTLIGILASVLQKHTYRERVLTQTALVFAMVCLQQVLVWLLLKWDGSAPAFGGFSSLAGKTILGTTLIGALASFLVVRFRPRSFDPATA